MKKEKLSQSIPFKRGSEEKAIERFDALRYSRGDILPAEIRLDMQKTMQNHCAVFRTGEGLKKGSKKMDMIYDKYTNIKESRGAHARDDYKERNDNDWLFHTLAWLDNKKTKLGSRPVTLRAMSNEVQSFPPKVRVY